MVECFSPLKVRGFPQISQGYPVDNASLLTCLPCLDLFSRVLVHVPYLLTQTENRREPKLPSVSKAPTKFKHEANVQ